MATAPRCVTLTAYRVLGIYEVEFEIDATLVREPAWDLTPPTTDVDLGHTTILSALEDDEPVELTDELRARLLAEIDSRLEDAGSTEALELLESLEATE